MRLVTSLTLDRSLLRKLLKLWDDGGDPRNPFENVLITPLFASPPTLDLVRRELKEKRGATVYFDSGGYYAQQGKIGFEELYGKLSNYYKDPVNQWADWYVLPDNVPTSMDSPEAVDAKVNDTITATRLFHAEMPLGIQERSMPVIQGHTFEQINKCVESFRGLSVTYMGFGSFGTSGTNSSINIADHRSATNITYLANELSNDGIRLHTFGISTPPVIYAFLKLGIFSFDSLAWQRSAGYGKAYLPFTRAYNVSHRSTKNAALSREEFELIKERTGHDCPFCRDFYQLSKNRLYRSLHNLVAVMDTIDSDNQSDARSIASLIAWKSNRYFHMFEDIYLG